MNHGRNAFTHLPDMSIFMTKDDFHESRIIDAMYTKKTSALWTGSGLQISTWVIHVLHCHDFVKFKFFWKNNCQPLFKLCTTVS